MNKKHLIVSVCAIGLLLTLTSCNDPDNDYYNKVGVSTEAISQKIDSAEIYFDASGSMKGYLCGNYKPFVEVISKFFNVADNYSFFLMKGNVSEDYKYTAAALGDHLDLFNGGDTPFENIIPALCNKVKKGKVCLFITDGIVYIDKNTSIGLPEFKEILKKRIKEKISGGDMSFAVLQYKADFHSPKVAKGGICYFDMNNTPKALECNNGERPFYVIAIGKKEDIRLLQQKHLDAEKEIYFGIHDKKFHAAQEDSQYVDPNIDLNLHLTIPECMSVLYDSDQKYFDTAIRIKGKSSQKNGDVGYSDYAVTKPGDNVLINAALPPEGTDSYNMYESINITIDNNIPKSWIDVSIDDDTNINMIGGRTFGLKYLLYGLKYGVENEEDKLLDITLNINQ